MTVLSPLGRAALAYAARMHWRVGPLKPREKFPPLTTHGYLDFSDDPEWIERVWSRWPNANVAIACEPSGFVVFDVDPRSGGPTTLARLYARLGPLPFGPLQQTGRGDGGTHLLVKDSGVPLRGTAGDGIEIKRLGYIVAEPSVHPSGGIYRWSREAHPFDVPLLELPSAWFEAMRLPETNVGPGNIPAESGLLARAFGHAGLVLRVVDEQRVAVVCPWASEHSSRGGRNDAVVFAPRKGSALGWFKCCHAHCAHRTLADVCRALPADALSRASIEVVAELAAKERAA